MVTFAIVALNSISSRGTSQSAQLEFDRLRIALR
jgi:hypothetical protein